MSDPNNTEYYEEHWGLMNYDDEEEDDPAYDAYIERQMEEKWLKDE